METVINPINPLAREFDACAECRLEIGGPNKYRVLSDVEILQIVDAFSAEAQTIELLAALKNLTFIAESVAHLRGLEREILPHTDAARELIVKIGGKQ